MSRLVEELPVKTLEGHVDAIIGKSSQRIEGVARPARQIEPQCQ